MNIIELQDSLKELPDSALMREMQMPSGNAPQFLVLSELKRRKRMRDEFQRREAADIPTVAEEVVTGAGMPQQGIMQAARAMAPKSSIAQNTGMDMAMPMQPTQAPQQPQMMADGGVVKMQTGGAISAQPTGDGGTYILMQDGERVPGTGLYPDFRSANEAARALRGSQPFQAARILEEPDPILETEVSELSQVSADPMAFAANDEIRRQLQLRQARGQRDDAEVGGIASLDPFGRAFMDEYRPDMSVASSREGIPEFGDAAYAQTNVADLLETMSKANEGIVRDELPASADDDLRFSRGTASSIAPSAGSEAINAMRAGADMAQMSGGIGRVSAEKLYPLLPKIDFNAAEAPADSQSSLQSDLADALQFAVDADERNEMMARLEEIDTPPPSVLGAQTEDSGISQTSRQSIAPIDRDSKAPISNEKQSIAPIDRESTLPVVSQDKTGPSGTKAVVPFYPELSIDDVMPPVLEQTTGDPISLEGGIESLLPPSLTGGDSGGTSKGDADFGSIESRIARMLADREKSAEADKWMSLAQAGMALMASKNPTFGGALGEAGQAGLKSLRESQKGRDAFETDMLKLQTQLDIAKERTGASRYSADQAFKAQQLSTEARSEATQQRLDAQTISGLSDLIAIYDNQLAELGVISGQAPPAAVADRYNQIIKERQAVIDELERRVGANVAATGGSDLSGVFDVPSAQR